jgi:hypothetical protein
LSQLIFIVFLGGTTLIKESHQSMYRALVIDDLSFKEELNTDASQLMMGLCPDKAIVSWK